MMWSKWYHTNRIPITSRLQFSWLTSRHLTTEFQRPTCLWDDWFETPVITARRFLIHVPFSSTKFSSHVPEYSADASTLRDVAECGPRQRFSDGTITWPGPRVQPPQAEIPSLAAPTPLDTKGNLSTLLLRGLFEKVNITLYCSHNK